MADQKDTDKKLSGIRGRSSTKRGEDLSNYVFGKVQPQAVPLEEAVLGALMLDKEALPIVIDILRSDSFYLDAHQLIYKAMLRLFEKSQPIDLLTVTESLKKSGDLEAVGGPYYLVELTNKVASAANIEYHARLIAQKYVQRELIRVSTKIIRDAYEDTTDVFNLLDDAEQGLFSIAQQNMSRGFESMSSLAAKAQKQIEELRKQESGLTGVPTGFTELDRLTSGFQRSDLIIVAARPGMGKTAMTLSLARNAAAQFGKPVAFFSLEMSALQLAQRVISMEAEISGMKMRNGQLADYEWEQLNAALERVSEVPMYIDDTPGINVFELRAKARRMKMQHDIQLIIIDYLQLMSGGGDNQRGNREQEVSAISRALKGLAKELDVPVIALSQLSRAVEVRGGSKRPQLSDLRESGCLTGDALLQDARTGRRISIKELAERSSQEPFEVVALDEEFKLGGHTLVKAFYSGRKKVFELQTRSGYRIKASANHPFLKLEGWTALEKLNVGDRIAIPRQIEIQKPDNPLSEEELILLAHLIGDGCILPKQPYHYTSADLANIEVVNKTVEQSQSQLQFLTTVGCHGERGAIIPEMAKALQAIEANPNTDVIPKEAWRYLIEPAMKANGLSWRGMFREMGLQYSSSIYKNGISRDLLNRINAILKDGQLTKLANSDVLWDEVVNITPLGEEDVYDATIEGVHNFVANDILVHNSIEQDADIVAFIYRPEYYDILEDEEGQSLKGIAEVIVAKHRHGALKTVRLRFTDEFARFSDLDDPDFGNLPSDTFESPQSNIITRPSKMNDDEDIPF